MSDSNRLQRTAHHEAGHAVVRYVLRGAAPYHVSIKPNPSIGMLGVASGDADFSEHPTREEVEAAIVELYAGYAAGIRFAPDCEDEHRAGSQDDYEKAERMLDWLDGGREKHEERLRAHASHVVEEQWPAIARVADELLQRTTLDDTEVETLFLIEQGSEEVTEADLARYRQFRAASPKAAEAREENS